MERPVCTPANSILETDLELAWHLDLIASLAINETELGYYVTATFMPRNTRSVMKKLNELGYGNKPVVIATMELLMSNREKVWYLATRRERNSPRLHKHLGRLNDFLREKYPTDVVILLRDQEWPGRKKVATRGAKPKPAA